MPTGILIPADRDQPLVAREFTSLTDYQSGVGGFVQSVNLFEPSSTLLVNEEGKIQRLPVNQRATLLLWLHNRPFLLRDEICGDAILLGPVRCGENTDAPTRFVTLLLEARAFVVESRSKRDPMTWHTVHRRRGFGSWVDAYGYALMWTRLKDVLEVRVTSA